MKTWFSGQEKGTGVAVFLTFSMECEEVTWVTLALFAQKELGQKVTGPGAPALTSTVQFQQSRKH